jgi:hypothetical protein
VINMIRPFAFFLALLALAVAPAVSDAHHPNHGKHKGHHKAHRHCTTHPGFVVKGTLVSFTGGADPTLTLTVTGANKHARRSGVHKGDEVTYSAATDKNGFKVKLSGYETGETPKAGDKVRLVGHIEYTKKKCAPGKTREERYGDVNVRRVKVVDVDS